MFNLVNNTELPEKNVRKNPELDSNLIFKLKSTFSHSSLLQNQFGVFFSYNHLKILKYKITCSFSTQLQAHTQAHVYKHTHTNNFTDVRDHNAKHVIGSIPYLHPQQLFKIMSATNVLNVMQQNLSTKSNFNIYTQRWMVFQNSLFNCFNRKNY